ncbi:DUF3990 domain-containing protein [uncultured Holdemanella sp.]|uniref:DUF3990 domain-containing protein n=1 Tax=uncultured Holdemanella sp. TaxID=1763549 RepID=UPI0025CF3CEB|nr:DUF3990 domain-containing protein [uncultured Holdemanella sp.]
MKNKLKDGHSLKKNKHVVNVYSYTENKNLNCSIFKEMSGEWLDFVVSSRQGMRHDYDIVEGVMVDDTI